MGTIQSLLEAQVWPKTFHTLHTAISAVGLATPLEDPRPTTLFAPDDETFNRLHPGILFDLLRDLTLLKKLLEYHIVPLKLTRADLLRLSFTSFEKTCGMFPLQPEHEELLGMVELPTLSGHSLLATASPTSHRVYVQGNELLELDLEAGNGIIHTVERVLWPPEINETMIDKQDSRR